MESIFPYLSQSKVSVSVKAILFFTDSPQEEIKGRESASSMTSFYAMLAEDYDDFDGDAV